MSPAPDPLRETQITPLATPADLAWAREHPAALSGLLREEDRIGALVYDDQELYDAEARVTTDQLLIRCSCPKGGREMCRHVAALLLRWATDPAAFAGPDAEETAGGLRTIPVRPTPTTPHAEPPYWMTTPLAERQRLSAQDLISAFEALTLREMRDFGARYGWAVKSTRKEAVAEQLAAHLGDPADVAAVLATLDPADRTVLQALVLAGQRPHLGGDALAQVAQWMGLQESGEQVLRRVARLRRAGLVVPLEVLWPSGFVQATVPEPIARALPPALEGVLPEAPSGDPPGDILLADPLPFVEAASQVLLVIAHQPDALRPPQPRPVLEQRVPILRGWDYVPEEVRTLFVEGAFQGGRRIALTVPPPGRALDDAATARLAPLAGGDVRLDLLYSLLVYAGVLQWGSPVVGAAQAQEAFLARDVREQRAILARALWSVTEWDVLWEIVRRDPALSVVRSPNLWGAALDEDALLEQLATTRELVSNVLAAVPEGRWVEVADIEAVLRAIWPTIGAATADRQGGYYGLSWEVQVKASRPKRDPWAASQGAYLRTLLAEPLHWLGFADLCLRDGRLAAVRLHGLADLYWDRVDAPPFPPHVTPPRRVAPHQALAIDGRTLSAPPAALPPAVHHLLSRIARLEEASAANFAYVLDARRAHEAFESGVLLGELLSAWERLLGTPLPATLREPLEAWWADYGRVRIYQRATVIELADDHALAELRAVTSLDKVLIAELSPRLVVIPEDEVDTLVAELEKAGYTPKQTDAI
jgi:hypothetical protein